MIRNRLMAHGGRLLANHERCENDGAIEVMILLWNLTFKKPERKGWVCISPKSSEMFILLIFLLQHQCSVTPGKNRHRWRTHPSPNLFEPDSMRGWGHFPLSTPSVPNLYPDEADEFLLFSVNSDVLSFKGEKQKEEQTVLCFLPF